MVIHNVIPHLPDHRILLGTHLVSLWRTRGRPRQMIPPVLVEESEKPRDAGDEARIRALTVRLSRHAGMSVDPTLPHLPDLRPFASEEALSQADGVVAATALAVASAWRRHLGMTERDPGSELALATVTGCYLGFSVLLVNGTILTPPGSTPLSVARLWRPGDPLPENDPPGGRLIQVGGVPASIACFFLSVIVNCARLDMGVRAQIFEALRSPQRAFYLTSLQWLIAHRESEQHVVEEEEEDEVIAVS